MAKNNQWYITTQLSVFSEG